MCAVYEDTFTWKHTFYMYMYNYRHLQEKYTYVQFTDVHVGQKGLKKILDQENFMHCTGKNPEKPVLIFLVRKLNVKTFTSLVSANFF